MVLSIIRIGSHVSHACFFAFGYWKGEPMAEKTHKTPPWFSKALENQKVSKEILLHFKKNYLTPKSMEEDNEEF